MSPQQPDGISNIRSRNVRNAGQSDLTKRERERERVEKRTGESEKPKKKRERWESVAKQKSQGLYTCD